jgi:beta-glucanase (GH16 family)
VWSDEFDFLDTTKWRQEISASGGDTQSFSFVSPGSENSFVSNGLLHLRPTLLETNINPKTGQPFGPEFLTSGVLDVVDIYGSCTDDTNSGCLRNGANGDIPPVASAVLTSVDSFSFRYGRVLIRAKLAAGDWLWPAIWMLPVSDTYGEWPASGEVDIAAIVGNQDFKKAITNEWYGMQKVSSVIYWGPNVDEDRSDLSSGESVNVSSTYGENFHTYLFDWNENGLSVYVDDQETPLYSLPDPLIDQNPDFVDFWEWGKPWNADTQNPWTAGTRLAPFDEPFFLLLDLSVGGLDGFFPDDGVNRGGLMEYAKPWSNNDDYVEAMQKFYEARSGWSSTWNSMQVDFVRIYQKV